ncbi:hypothetical protein BHM03_00053840, partial [Ensete ventricosum]
REYELHVPLPGERPYDAFLDGFTLPTDDLKAGFRFSLHSIIEIGLVGWQISPSQMGSNSWRYMVAFLGEFREVDIVPTQDLFMACFCLCHGQADYYLTTQSRFRVSGAPSNNKARRTKGKDPTEEAAGVTRHPQTIRELCEVDGRAGEDKYLTARMSDLPKVEAGCPPKVHWSNLPASTRFWPNGSVATKFTRGMLHLTITKQLYGTPSEELNNRATKSVVWFSTALIDHVHDAAGSEALAAVEKRATDLEAKVERMKVALGDAEQWCKDLEHAADNTRRELKDIRDNRRNMEDEMLKLTQDVEALRSELHRWVPRP